MSTEAPVKRPYLLYESHITLLFEERQGVAMLGSSLGWKPSAIAGDPVLGPATYTYLTRHSYDLRDIRNKMEDCVKTLQAAGYKVVREKIEYIVHDKRY